MRRHEKQRDYPISKVGGNRDQQLNTMVDALLDSDDEKVPTSKTVLPRKNEFDEKYKNDFLPYARKLITSHKKTFIFTKNKLVDFGVYNIRYQFVVFPKNSIVLLDKKVHEKNEVYRGIKLAREGKYNFRPAQNFCIVKIHDIEEKNTDNDTDSSEKDKPPNDLKQEVELNKKIDRSIITDTDYRRGRNGRSDYETEISMLPYRPGEDLYELIRKMAENPGDYPYIFTLKLIIETLKAVQRIHEKKFLHNDLKPENFICNYNEQMFTVYAIDLAHSARINNVNNKYRGTPDYMAPECIRSGIFEEKWDAYSVASDIFPLGIMIAEMLGSTISWQHHEAINYFFEKFDDSVLTINDKDYKDIFKKINFKESLLKEHKRKVSVILGKVLSDDPARRPSLNSLVTFFGDLHKEAKQIPTEKKRKEKQYGTDGGKEHDTISVDREDLESITGSLINHPKHV